MDTEEIDKLEEHFLKTNINLYKAVIAKIKSNFDQLEVRELGDYYRMAQDISSSISEHLNQQKQKNKIKETFKNHKK